MIVKKMGKINMSKMSGISALVLFVVMSLVAANIQAETVVDLGFKEGRGVPDVLPARSLDVNTDSEATYAWSDSALLFNGVASKSQKLYGAFTTTGSGIVDGANLAVRDVPADADFLRFDALKSGSGTQSSRVLILWDSADFLASGYTSFDASEGSSLVLGISAFANPARGMGARFVIRDGSQFYISSFTTTETASVNGTTAGLKWGAFDVADWASFDNSAADAGMGVTFSAQTFDHVTGVGFIAEIERPNTIGPVFRVDDFQATLVSKSQ
jgi:hypothetical protein